MREKTHKTLIAAAYALLSIPVAVHATVLIGESPMDIPPALWGIVYAAAVTVALLDLFLWRP
jgi:hypothetical protein